MAHEPYYVTAEALERLRVTLQELKTEKRSEILERLKEAKAFGDLTENSEYDAAKQAQALNEGKIMELEDLMKRAAVIKGRDHYSTVVIGSRVEVKQGLKSSAYTIVGPEESDPSKGYISNQSPLGKNLLGKSIGDEFVMKNLLGKEIKYKIVRISAGVK